LVVPAVVYFDLDPFHFILEAYIAPHPYERTIPCIILLLVTRLVLFFFCVVDFLRFVLILTITGILMVFAGISVLCRLDKVNDIDVAYKFYSRLKIAFAAVFEKLKIITLFLVFVLQALTVMALWLVLKCWGVLPYFLSVIGLLFSVYLVITAMLMISALAKTEEESLILLVKKRNRYHCTNFKNRLLYLPYIKWQAQQAIGIPCGNLFIFKRSAVSTYFSQMFENLANSVILMEP